MTRIFFMASSMLILWLVVSPGAVSLPIHRTEGSRLGNNKKWLNSRLKASNFTAILDHFKATSRPTSVRQSVPQVAREGVCRAYDFGLQRCAQITYLVVVQFETAFAHLKVICASPHPPCRAHSCEVFDTSLTTSPLDPQKAFASPIA